MLVTEPVLAFAGEHVGGDLCKILPCVRMVDSKVDFDKPEEPWVQTCDSRQ